MASPRLTPFLRDHYQAFNAARTVEAAEGWIRHLASDGHMMVTLAGAMSTAQLGRSLAPLIRQGKVHAISCTGANLEEDLFNLVGYHAYQYLPDYRFLTPAQEEHLRDTGQPRVTDVTIPEEEAVAPVAKALLPLWQAADRAGTQALPHEYLYDLIRSGALEKHYEGDPDHSWMIAAADMDLPIVTPGWEDSTLGNYYVSCLEQHHLQHEDTVRLGVGAMRVLVDWYRTTSRTHPMGFFQIGGGIAGDFPICVVPLLRLELHDNVPYWSYFCQISDAVTSYGGYSGATPNEKITWEKLSKESQMYVIESDATVVAPLVFQMVLDG